MTRVVADTNIYVSALVYGGLPGTFLDLAVLRSFTLLTSPILLDELDRTLRVKFRVSPTDAAAARARLETLAHLVRPDTTLSVIADDPDDNRVLECAVKGNADYIVSGDRHLLKLASYDGIAIVTARRFLDAIEANPDC